MIKLFNTLTRSLEEFKPIHANEVGIYSCGPTVYQYAHIGNLRAYIFADILRRSLEFNSYGVKHVVNITDVGHLTSNEDEGEDKVEQEAKREGKSAWDVAAFYTEAFVKDLERLNINLPTVVPRATDHISGMIDLIKLLQKKGFAYITSDGVYFDTTKLKDYGKLARLNLAGQKAGARVEEGDKKHPSDFALWRLTPKAENRQMEWDSPWGRGIPGWHIECSVMSTKYLGQPFDIHTGGIDHIPVHHTNEIAQSEAATGKPLANFFLHSEFLLWGKDKMSKSLGNIATLQELIDKGFDPLAFRYLVLTASYHTKLEFTFEALEGAQNALSRLRHFVSSLPDPTQVNTSWENKFRQAINNDLDTPEGLAIVWKMIGEGLDRGVLAATLFKLDEVLGLGLQDEQQKSKVVDPETQKLLTLRDQARLNKDFAESDRLRVQIESRGYILEDSSDETRVIKKD